MSDKKLFSQIYSTDSTIHADKKKFRNRLLKYLENFVNANSPEVIYEKCRSKMGLDIEKVKKSIPELAFQPDRCQYVFLVEKTLDNRPINDILDFIGICFYAIEPDQNKQPSLKTYIKEVNSIFREESMCYELNDNGKVQYNPDEEFHQVTKSTLILLGKPKYNDYLTVFNETLDDFYKNHGTESPITSFFKLIETFVLSIPDNNNINILNGQSVGNLISLLNKKTSKDSSFTKNDIESITGFENVLNGWVKMCNKYRHGKPEQLHDKVPKPLFNLIFSIGISIFRSLLEFDDKYELISASKL